MKIKVSEATPLQLDCAVQSALLLSLKGAEFGLLVHHIGYGKGVRPYSTDPTWAWPIIERERIRITPWDRKPGQPKYGDWFAGIYNMEASGDGPTSLIAAMRCFVVSRLGEEIEVQDELL